MYRQLKSWPLVWPRQTFTNITFEIVAREYTIFEENPIKYEIICNERNITLCVSLFTKYSEFKIKNVDSV